MAFRPVLFNGQYFGAEYGYYILPSTMFAKGFTSYLLGIYLPAEEELSYRQFIVTKQPCSSSSEGWSVFK